MICDGCGCTDEEPCIDEATGLPCSWADDHWCTACADEDEGDRPLERDGEGFYFDEERGLYLR